MNSASQEECIVDLELALSTDNQDEDLIKQLELKIVSVGEQYHDVDNHEDLSKLIKSVQRIVKRMFNFVSR